VTPSYEESQKSGGLQFQASPGKKFERPYLNSKSWVWWSTPVPATTGSINKSDHSPGWPREKTETLSKITRVKWTGSMAQAVELLSSNPSTTCTHKRLKSIKKKNNERDFENRKPPDLSRRPLHTLSNSRTLSKPWNHARPRFFVFYPRMKS
jgi:hypothetical protein